MHTIPFASPAAIESHSPGNLLMDTRMYEQHFGLTSLPFCTNPADWQFFESESTAEILPQVQHALSTAPGVAVVTGPDGVGKTILLHQLQALLSRKGQALVIAGTSLQTTEDLYVGIRRGLRTLDGSPVPGGSTRWEVVEHLQKAVEFWGPVGLLIDDAHLLTPLVFTELQFLLEQRTDSQALCRLLLAGSLALEETLATPTLNGFSQRIRSFSFLTPLRMAEAVEYLRSRVAHAGGELSRCFETNAVETIVTAAEGSPRCLNLLADESMMVAFHSDETQVSKSAVLTALEHLKHLPHAWNISVSDDDAALNDSVETTSSWQSSSDGVIEIGAPPADAGNVVEIGRSEPDVAETVDVAECADWQAVEPEAEPALEDVPGDIDDELPSLDELQNQSSTPGVDTNYELQTAESEARSFEEGYRLAELEAVDSPTVEIDEDLERRLLQAVATVSDADDQLATSGIDADAFLPEFVRWQPAGTWVGESILDAKLIRQRSAVDSSDVMVHHEQSVAEISPVADVTTRFAVSIPDAEEPPANWPPSDSRFGPQQQIEVAESDTNSTVPREAAAPAGTSVESTAIVGSFDDAANVDPALEPIPAVTRWADGQLLASSHNSIEESDSATSGTSMEQMVLKIADVIQNRVEDSAIESMASEEPPAADGMFTLPITFDENRTTGGATSLAGSDRHAPSDTAVSSTRRSGSPLRHDDAVIPPGSPVNASLAGQDYKADASLNSLSDAVIPPRILGQNSQVVSVSAPAVQLRSAAGAESCVLNESHAPALSIPDWTVADQQVDDAGRDSSDEPSRGFRNLFTRIRRRHNA